MTMQHPFVPGRDNQPAQRIRMRQARALTQVRATRPAQAAGSMRHASLARRGLLAVSVFVVSGCAMLPVLQVAGLAAQVVVAADHLSKPDSSTRSTQLGSALPQDVCIEFNPDAPVPDLVPALQFELLTRGVRSRVYERGTAGDRCSTWLRYAASLAWAQPMFEAEYRPYMATASLYLIAHSGALLAVSHYEVRPWPPQSKWTDTRVKLAPVVKSLLTGVPA